MTKGGGTARQHRVMHQRRTEGSEQGQNWVWRRTSGVMTLR
jgi:hypothetical protein